MSSSKYKFLHPTIHQKLQLLILWAGNFTLPCFSWRKLIWSQNVYKVSDISMVWLRYSSRSAILAYLKLLTRLLDFLHNPKKVCSHNGRFYVTPEEKKISQNVSALFTRGGFLTRGWKIHSLLEVNTEYSLCRVGMATLNLHSLTLALPLPCSPSNLQIKSWFSIQMYILGKDTRHADMNVWVIPSRF